MEWISRPRYKPIHLDQIAKNMCWKQISLFNNWCWENWISTCRKLKLDLRREEDIRKGYRRVNMV
jgi:hypothetical protein